MATTQGSGTFTLSQIVALIAANSFLFGNLNSARDTLVITNKYSQGHALTFPLFWAKADRAYVYDLVHVVDGAASVLGTLDLGQAGNWTRKAVEAIVSGEGSPKFPNATFTIGEGTGRVSDPSEALTAGVAELEAQLAAAKAALKAAQG